MCQSTLDGQTDRRTYVINVPMKPAVRMRVVARLSPGHRRLLLHVVGSEQLPMSCTHKTVIRHLAPINTCRRPSSKLARTSFSAMLKASTDGFPRTSHGCKICLSRPYLKNKSRIRDRDCGEGCRDQEQDRSYDDKCKRKSTHTHT